MRLLIRVLPVVLLCLGGIGLYRGWFTFSTPARDTENPKINLSISVDEGKVEADAEKLKARIAERVAERAKERADKAKAQEAK
jgi:hypothetical protein